MNGIAEKVFMAHFSGRVVACFMATAAVHAAPPLQTYNIDPEQISVSGLSSGGYMAVQMHVAYSSGIMGAGVLAAGPYLCAEANALYATTRCLNSGSSLLPPAAYFWDLTEALSDAGRIDPIANLAGDRAWLFTGGADNVVATPVVDRLHDYYEFFVDPDGIAYLRDQIPDAQHAMITDDYGRPCDFEGGAYINDCDFDAAGALLNQRVEVAGRGAGRESEHLRSVGVLEHAKPGHASLHLRAEQL
jgi:poly(3-hydroxybutyrate) depolymerase